MHDEPDLVGALFVGLLVIALGLFAAWVLYELLPAWVTLAWLTVR